MGGVHGPGVFPFTLGLLAVGLGVVGVFFSLGRLMFTVLDSAVRVSLILRIFLQRLSEWGFCGVGEGFMGLKPKIFLVVGDVRNDV